jgi:hypothetical protein
MKLICKYHLYEVQIWKVESNLAVTKNWMFNWRVSNVFSVRRELYLHEFQAPKGAFCPYTELCMSHTVRVTQRVTLSWQPSGGLHRLSRWTGTYIRPVIGGLELIDSECGPLIHLSVSGHRTPGPNNALTCQPADGFNFIVLLPQCTTSSHYFTNVLFHY